MLCEKTVNTVKATIPVLEENGVALTKHFYNRMFSHNPEVKKFFNLSHQKDSSQPEALAAAILAYAKNIDNLGVLGDAVELIAYKHASLQIKAEHYPIVGTNLIESIKEVLNLDDDNDIIVAWKEAYGLLADILIAREQKIYDDNLKKFGWQGFKKFKVIKKEIESSSACSFYLKHDEFKQFDFKPGQYITVKLLYGDTTIMRNYSISSATGEDYLRITVKNDNKGLVSKHLHNKIEVGDEIEVAPPCGEFFLDLEEKNDKSIVLISAGIGITPLISMLLSELKTNNKRKILFICGKKSKSEHPFVDKLKELTEKNFRLETVFFYENEVQENAKYGLIDLSIIKETLGTQDAQYFFCGPKEFMVSVQEGLLKDGIDAKDIHFEFFGSKNA